MDDVAIRTQALRKSFGDIEAVAGLDLTVSAGEIFGLVGPDGAGKTTTMRLLAGLLTPDSGSAHVLGIHVAERPEEGRWKLGYLPQSFGLLGDLTVAENIRYFTDLYCLSPREVKERREELLRITGLKSFTGRLASALSGGMKQKLALTCALIHRPRVLLLDEPARGVDPLSRRDLWRIIYGLPADGVTVLVATPHADEGERCNRVGVIMDGRLVTAGSPQELIAQHTATLIEVRADDTRAARDALRQAPGVLAVSALGQTLRVSVTAHGPDTDEIRHLLSGVGVGDVACERSQPRLADALLTLGEGARAHA